MTHTMTVDPRSCDGVNPPTRYQTAALAPGSFFSGHVTTVLPAAGASNVAVNTLGASTGTGNIRVSNAINAAGAGTLELLADNRIDDGVENGGDHDGQADRGRRETHDLIVEDQQEGAENASLDRR